MVVLVDVPPDVIQFPIVALGLFNMKCLTPLQIGPDLVPCGSCYACQTNNRNSWDLRLRIEHMNNNFAWFITLTYSDEHLPPLNMVIGGHLSRFVKDLRNMYRDVKFRYYGIGEYGERFGRPHYHILLFSDTDVNIIYAANQIWQYGFTDVGTVTSSSIHYVTKWHINPKLRQGESTEVHGLTRQSKGIGRALLDHLDQYNIMPNYFLDGHRFPVSRYYRKKLGFVVSDVEDIPTYIKRKYKIDSDAAILQKIADMQESYRKKQLQPRKSIF